MHDYHKRHSDYLKHRGILLVISSPSGAGKTTITRALLAEEKYVTLSISATTRPPRPKEKPGDHYHFKTEEEFKQLIEEEALFEHAHVFGHWYGTLRAPVEQKLEEGYDVLLDIDWQGAQQMIQEARNYVVSVFLLPPSLSILEARLRSRAEDSEKAIKRRMCEAIDEISHWAEYDYVVVNDNLEKSINDVRSILRSERLKRTRQLGLSHFIHHLTEADEALPVDHPPTAQTEF